MTLASVKGDFLAVLGSVMQADDEKGVRLNVWAKLERTGIGLYDNAVFFNINRAYEMSEKSQNDPSIKPLALLRKKRVEEISPLLTKVSTDARSTRISTL